MPDRLNFEYARFLESRQAIDERSLDRRIWERFLERLRETARTRGRLRLLEIGSGTGALAERVFRELGDVDLRYVLLDELVAHQHAARFRLERALRAGHLDSVRSDEGSVSARKGGLAVEFEFVQADASSWLGSSAGGYDAVIGQAVVDLFDVPSFLRAALSMLDRDGAFYFPTTYDGMTEFSPLLEAAFDREVTAFYDWTMDERAHGNDWTGGCRSGRFALEALYEIGCRVLDAGASDWFVVPQQGAYRTGERYFLHQILGFIESEARNHPRRLDQDRLDVWLRTRRKQVETGDLMLRARHVDIFGIR